MGYNIIVESKHFKYFGNKHSDLMMLFDLFLAETFHYSQPYYGITLNRDTFKKVYDFLEKRNEIKYKDYSDLKEKINNIYIRMEKKDTVNVKVF